ncbi:MAG: DegV family protein [Clostridiales bacterium]|nr:DegV family protein [Clostridiales bacterium]
MAIRIITDTPSDISFAEAKEMNIDLVPLKINVDDKSYREGIDITVDEFYQMLETSKTLPTTSTPSPENFLTYFEEARDAGDDVIVISLAAGLSGTYQCAVLAKEIAGYSNIHVIDSEQATLGEMVLVRYAVKLRDEGKTVKEIVDAIETSKKKVVILAVLDTLEYLQKGGRLPKSVAIAGGLLKIKPMITLKEGAIEVVGKARGHKAALKNMLAEIDKYPDFDTSAPIVYGYTKTPDQCLKLKEEADKKYNLKDTKMYPIGSVIGTHAGPGAFAIGFLHN